MEQVEKLEFIEKSVDWISKILPSEHYPSVLDIGCGPGLYTERYAKKGYRVVGVDFSTPFYKLCSDERKEKRTTY